MGVDIIQLKERGKKEYFEFVRVNYGKKGTPINDREYRIGGFNSPVGTINEIVDWYTNHHFEKKYDGFVLVDVIELEVTIVDIDENKNTKIEVKK